MKKNFLFFAILLLPAVMVAQMTITFSSVTNATCYSACDGSATASVTGGTPPYNYLWMPGNITTPTASGLCAGSYTCTVTDQSSGTASSILTISSPGAITLTTLPVSASVCVNSSVSYSVNALGGSPPYVYSWTFPGGSPSSATTPNPSITYNTVGSYTATVTVVDGNGCSAQHTVPVTVSAASVGGTVSGSTSACSNANSGTMTLSGHTGSVIRWEFSTDGGVTWTNVANTSTSMSYSNVTQTRLYRALVQNGACPSAYSSNATLTIMPAPTVSISPSSPTICSGSSVALTASGATTYVWMPGSLSGNPVTVTPATTTTYTCTGTSASGCYDTEIVTVYVNQTPTVTITPSPPTICSGGSVTLAATGATTYTWMPGSLSGSPVTVTPSTTTTYTVTGTDANGCTGNAMLTVNVNQPPTASISGVDPTCNNNDGSATVTPTGNSPFTYVWTPAVSVSPTAAGLVAGTYTCITNDVNGCTVVSTITLLDSCDFVWPGDANDDAVADNVDILDIGIANGATGTTRANATTNWVGQPSAPWGQTLLSGTDYKWVDCDGNGVIDPVDTQAVVANYGMTHNNRYAAPTYEATAPALSISFDQDSVAAGNSGTITLVLGDVNNQANNVYGIAFRLNYDAAQISTSSVGMSGGTSWFGTTGNDMMRVVLHPNPAMGYVDVAITRLDQQNVSGYGTIGQFYYTTTTTMAGTGSAANVQATITNVLMVNATGTSLSCNVIDDSVTVADSAIITTVPQMETAPLAVYPNPAQGDVKITLGNSYAGKDAVIVLRDITGREIARVNSNGNTQVDLNLENYSGGVYCINVECPGMPTETQKLILSDK